MISSSESEETESIVLTETSYKSDKLHKGDVNLWRRRIR